MIHNPINIGEVSALDYPLMLNPDTAEIFLPRTAPFVEEPATEAGRALWQIPVGGAKVKWGEHEIYRDISTGKICDNVKYTVK
jgi:hypothetical protein